MNSKRGPRLLTLLIASSWCGTLAAAEQLQVPQLQVSHPPGIELPEGEGRVLLLAACTRCHDLRGLPAYKGYWNRQRWRDMLVTMVKNGAPLSNEQAEVLAQYLAEHFGQPLP